MEKDFIEVWLEVVPAGNKAPIIPRIKAKPYVKNNGVVSFYVQYNDRPCLIGKLRAWDAETDGGLLGETFIDQGITPGHAFILNLSI